MTDEGLCGEVQEGAARGARAHLGALTSSCPVMGVGRACPTQACHVLSSGRHGPGASSLTYLLGGGRSIRCRRCWWGERGAVGRLQTEQLFPAQG